jgi:hypothetical protein
MNEQPRPAAPTDEHAYLLSVEEAADRYAAGGHPRTIRAIQKYCRRDDLESQKVENVRGTVRDHASVHRPAYRCDQEKREAKRTFAKSRSVTPQAASNNHRGFSRALTKRPRRSTAIRRVDDSLVRFQLLGALRFSMLLEVTWRCHDQPPRLTDFPSTGSNTRESNAPSNSIVGSLQCNYLGTGYCPSDVRHVPVMGEDDWLYSVSDCRQGRKTVCGTGFIETCE